MLLRRLSVAALVLGVSHSASAGVVFVVSVGKPSPEAERLLAPFIDEMAHQPGMYVSPAEIRTRLDDRAPRPGLADPSLQVADLVKLYEEGYRLFKAGKWDASIDKLAPAVRKAQDNPVLLVDQTHHDTWMTGLVALGMSRFRKKDLQGSEQVNQELARSFPDREAAIRAAHGSEPARHYAAAQNALDARGRGTLVMDVNDSTALIYVNEWDRPQNATFEANVLPGPYRVLVRRPGTDGLRYDTVVEPNRTTHLSVDLSFDETIHLTDPLAGFVFASPGERDRYALGYARRLATAIDTGNNVVVLVQLTTWEGHLAVMGTLHRVDTGAWVRARVAPLDGRDDPEKLRALARELLRSHIEDARIIALADPALRASAPPPKARGWQTWAAGAGATAALAIGGGLLYLRQGCGADTDPCSSPDRSAMPGYVGLAAGVALGMLATYWFIHDAKISRGPSLTAAPSSSGAMVGMTIGF
jgi:hypothetical protein